VRDAKLWQKLLGVERTVVDQVIFDDEAGALVASVRPYKGATRRCGICSRRCAWEDRGEGRRRWRTLDLGSIPTYLEADAPRVRCCEHGIVVASVPWARHRARHSKMFEDQVAWLAKHTSRSAVEELMRIAWRTVGAIVTRVVADAHGRADPLDELRRIGIDEIAYKKGFKYLIVTWNHTVGFNGSPFHELRGRLHLVDWSGGEVAGARPARTSGGVARDLGGPRPGAEDDRRLCPWTC
jgi:transposase